MKQCIAVLLAGLMLLGVSARAEDHLVTTAEADARLHEAAAQRHADAAAVSSLLQTPEAATAARKLGVDSRTLVTGLDRLSDEDLRDLARRAEHIGTDPVAGSAAQVDRILAIVLLLGVLYFLFLLWAVRQIGD